MIVKWTRNVESLEKEYVETGITPPGVEGLNLSDDTPEKRRVILAVDKLLDRLKISQRSLFFLGTLEVQKGWGNYLRVGIVAMEFSCPPTQEEAWAIIEKMIASAPEIEAELRKRQIKLLEDTVLKLKENLSKADRKIQALQQQLRERGLSEEEEEEEEAEEEDES